MKGALCKEKDVGVIASRKRIKKNIDRQTSRQTQTDRHKPTKTD